jgi:hypothetical protein
VTCRKNATIFALLLIFYRTLKLSMEMEMLTKSEHFKKKTETDMFNNLVPNNSDLLINVEGCNHKQNITTADLIRNCKIKNKILDRSIFEPQETMLEFKMKGYHGQGSSKGLKVNHMVVPRYAKKKRVSNMLTDEELINEYFQFEHDGETITESLGESRTSSRHYYCKHLKQDTNYAIDISSNTDSISIASNSYEMIEYGLNPYEIEDLKMSRRKSCLCKHSAVIFGENEDSEYTDTFPEEFIATLDHFYMDSEVTFHHQY